MDQTTRDMVLETLVHNWAKTARCLGGLSDDVDPGSLLRRTWSVSAAVRKRCGWTDEAPREWTPDDTYRVRVELSRLRLDLEEEWSPPRAARDVGTTRAMRVTKRACALTGVLLGWPDGTLAAAPRRVVWDLIGESMEVMNRASTQCTSEISESMKALDRVSAARSGERDADDEWEFSLGPGA